MEKKELLTKAENGEWRFNLEAILNVEWSKEKYNVKYDTCISDDIHGQLIKKLSRLKVTDLNSLREQYKNAEFVKQDLDLVFNKHWNEYGLSKETEKSLWRSYHSTLYLNLLKIIGQAKIQTEKFRKFENKTKTVGYKQKFKDQPKKEKLEEISFISGFPVEHLTAIIKVVKNSQAVVVFRPVSKRASELINDLGCCGKPMHVKAKSSNIGRNLSGLIPQNQRLSKAKKGKILDNNEYGDDFAFETLHDFLTFDPVCYLINTHTKKIVREEENDKVLFLLKRDDDRLYYEDHPNTQYQLEDECEVKEVKILYNKILNKKVASDYDLFCVGHQTESVRKERKLESDVSGLLSKLSKKLIKDIEEATGKNCLTTHGDEALNPCPEEIYSTKGKFGGYLAVIPIGDNIEIRLLKTEQNLINLYNKLERRGFDVSINHNWPWERDKKGKLQKSKLKKQFNMKKAKRILRVLSESKLSQQDKEDLRKKYKTQLEIIENFNKRFLVTNHQIQPQEYWGALNNLAVLKTEIADTIQSFKKRETDARKRWGIVEQTVCPVTKFLRRGKNRQKDITQVFPYIGQPSKRWNEKKPEPLTFVPLPKIQNPQNFSTKEIYSSEGVPLLDNSKVGGRIVGKDS